MMKQVFTGVCTALVTPFLGDQVNYPMMEQLLQRQIANGIPAVVIAGTTGEAPALSDHEKIELFRRSKAYVGNECTIIAGTGGNNTEHAVQLSKAAEDAGADALLVVSPYYNKGTEDGIYLHYLSIAKAVNIPVIVYNVPGRTGKDLDVSLYKRLSTIENIVGVKEASTDITKITRIRCACHDCFTIWTGNDEQAVPAMALGAKGVISVAANVCPGEVKAMTDAMFDGDIRTAAEYQRRLQNLNELLFCDVNPVPVKAAMKLIGFDCGQCRLPLADLTADKYDRLQAYFR